MLCILDEFEDREFERKRERYHKILIQLHTERNKSNACKYFHTEK